MDAELIKIKQETKKMKDRLNEIYIEWDTQIAEMEESLTRY